TYLAYNKAGVDVNIKNRNLYIYYIYDGIADSDLEIGDRIISYDDIEAKDSIELRKYILGKNEGDTVKFKVIRNKKEVDAYAKVKVESDTKIIGILVYTIFEYENNPDIHYAYQESEVGSSGGLMLSLSIYNSLVEEDITKGKKISGTGTIEMDGTVGEIAGIKYKILGAVKDKADIFIVPANNYEEAEKLVKDRKLKIKLIKAESFEQVLEELGNI
ncbi:MAG: PDZ domain-containing protein, partial [Bacilli bacterium]|nr:PDZ domain-containing protein [Bacilli bacterium]